VCTCTSNNVYTCYIICIIHNAARGIKNMLRSILHAQVAPRPKFAERVQRTAEVSRFLEFPDTAIRYIAAGGYYTYSTHKYIYIFIRIPSLLRPDRRAPPRNVEHHHRCPAGVVTPCPNCQRLTHPPTQPTTRTDPKDFFMPVTGRGVPRHRPSPPLTLSFHVPCGTNASPVSFV